jgi:hypothetical protein
MALGSHLFRIILRVRLTRAQTLLSLRRLLLNNGMHRKRMCSIVTNITGNLSLLGLATLLLRYVVPVAQ